MLPQHGCGAVQQIEVYVHPTLTLVCMPLIASQVADQLGMNLCSVLVLWCWRVIYMQ